VALILAAGYLLKLSFDRGWITPAARCVGGFVAGAAVGALGWRLEPRYRTYGASLVGAGAAIMYLAVWAASAVYSYLPPPTGIAGLALVSLALATLAFAFDVEALGATAALGAFFAPTLLGRGGKADTLLLYLACMAAAFGWVAARKRWRLTAFIVALSYFGLVAPMARSPNAAALILYAVAGGAGGLYLGLREHWFETRFLSFWGGWGLAAEADERLTTRWPILLAAITLAAPVWVHGLKFPLQWLRTGERGEADARKRADWSAGETLYFLATPLLFGWAVHRSAPAYFSAHPGLVPLIVAIPYLLVGYVRPLPRFAMIGASALAYAVLQHWSGLGAVWALLALALAFAMLDHALDRNDGRWYAVGGVALALGHLYGTDQLLRQGNEMPFVGPWAMALWALVATAAVLAARLWRRAGPDEFDRTAIAALWSVAGVLVFFGVTAEIQRYFARFSGIGSASLAGQLSVSAWWLAYAAALVVLGFARRVAPVRWAGLAVAGIASVKVIVSDLAELDSLWRVASVFCLATVSLALAYLYHRRSRMGGAPPLSSAEMSSKELP
jgi:uncharacterized membrane protein